MLYLIFDLIMLLFFFDCSWCSRWWWYYGPLFKYTLSYTHKNV